MTAQFPEVLILDGQKHALCTEPLARYLRSASIDRVFRPTNSACWRGYIGTWEVIDDRLCLTGIEGNLKSGEIANLATIFPNATGPVFAHWFSGFCASHRVKCLNMFMVGMRAPMNGICFSNSKQEYWSRGRSK